MSFFSSRCQLSFEKKLARLTSSDAELLTAQPLRRLAAEKSRHDLLRVGRQRFCPLRSGRLPLRIFL